MFELPPNWTSLVPQPLQPWLGPAIQWAASLDSQVPPLHREDVCYLRATAFEHAVVCANGTAFAWLSGSVVLPARALGLLLAHEYEAPGVYPESVILSSEARKRLGDWVDAALSGYGLWRTSVFLPALTTAVSLNARLSAIRKLWAEFAPHVLDDEDALASLREASKRRRGRGASRPVPWLAVRRQLEREAGTADPEGWKLFIRGFFWHLKGGLVPGRGGKIRYNYAKLADWLAQRIRTDRRRTIRGASTLSLDSMGHAGAEDRPTPQEPEDTGALPLDVAAKMRELRDAVGAHAAARRAILGLRNARKHVLENLWRLCAGELSFDQLAAETGITTRSLRLAFRREWPAVEELLRRRFGA